MRTREMCRGALLAVFDALVLFCPRGAPGHGPTGGWVGFFEGLGRLSHTVRCFQDAALERVENRLAVKNAGMQCTGIEAGWLKPVWPGDGVALLQSGGAAQGNNLNGRIASTLHFCLAYFAKREYA